MSDPTLVPPVSERDHVQGDRSSLVTLVEYGDFQCPFCGEAFPILKRVQQRMGDSLKFVFRHFPIATIHPHAEHAAAATESAAARWGEEAFWQMHDRIFVHQRALADPFLAHYATEAGFDGDAVLDDLREERFRPLVRESFRNGARSGVNGTPTLFIDGIRYDGARDENTLVAVLRMVSKENQSSL